MNAEIERKLIDAIWGKDYGKGLPALHEDYQWTHIDHAPKVITPGFAQDVAGNWFECEYAPDLDKID